MNCAWRAKKLATVLKDSPNSQNKGASKRSGPLKVVLVGVEFIDENGGDPGVRLRKRHQKKG
jgi:hypothetical protein